MTPSNDVLGAIVHAEIETGTLQCRKQRSADCWQHEAILPRVYSREYLAWRAVGIQYTTPGLRQHRTGRGSRVSCLGAHTVRLFSSCGMARQRSSSCQDQDRERNARNKIFKLQLDFGVLEGAGPDAEQEAGRRAAEKPCSGGGRRRIAREPSFPQQLVLGPGVDAERGRPDEGDGHERNRHCGEIPRSALWLSVLWGHEGTDLHERNPLCLPLRMFGSHSRVQSCSA